MFNRISEVNNENYLLNPEHEVAIKFKPTLNIGVLASGNGSNFEALVNATNNLTLNAHISLLIVNNPNCMAIHRAKRLNVPFKLLNHEDYPNREDYEKKIVEIFRSYKVEGIVMAGWMRIVTNTLISAYPDRLVNIHPSLLPSFRGINAIEQALNAGVKISGCSVHIVSKEVDSGRLLIQAAVPVYKTDTKETLSKRIQKYEHRILPKGVFIAAKNWRNA